MSRPRNRGSRLAPAARSHSNSGGTTKNDPSGETVTAIARAADVLLLFADSEASALGVSEIARTLHLSKAVTHRILTSLRSRSLVYLDPQTRHYSLGNAALKLGLRYLEDVDIFRLAPPVLLKLSSAMNETATLSIRTGNRRVYVDQVTPHREVKMTVMLGRSYPLHAGSSSKALLAFLDDTALDSYLGQPLDALTDRTITDPAMLRNELATIRERGYASSDGERQLGAGSVAAPILDRHGDPVASMSICGPAERLCAARADAAQLLTAETALLSERMGYVAAPSSSR